MIYNFIYDNKKICYFAVENNYVWFKKNRNSKKYKTQIIKNVRKIFNELLETNKYLFTFSKDTVKLNRWHTFVGMQLKESFVYKNKKYNIWVA